MLEINEISASYSGLKALHSVSLTIGMGEFTSIIGPNGAGKTTLLKCISGSVKPDHGTIRWDGEELLAIEASRRPHHGIAHIPEGRLIFATLSVEDNLVVAANTPKARAAWKDSLDAVWSLFPPLYEKRNELGGTLSGGQQQMLAIGRGLVAVPTLLMLDEPSMGLAPAVADSIFDAVSKIHRESNITILLVEQRSADALELCDSAYILETGIIRRVDFADGNLAKDEIGKTYFGDINNH
jgi:branched-chain amino acid transport system ATP-binding protein